MKTTYLSALKSGAAPVAVALVLAAAPAHAQTAPANDASAEPAIVVTGTLFRSRAATETASPVSVVTAEMLDKRGLSTVQDGLQTLAANNGPALTNSFTANGAFAAGASAISLRALSTNSTLVLFDGMRAAYYALADDASRNFVDLNTIPDDIVEKVDVLRDGASASYGADAIAGVVNIRTKREFKGIAGRAETGISSRGDAASHRVGLTAGWGDLDDNGYNVYASGYYYKSDLLKNSARGYPFNTGDYRALGGPNDVSGGIDETGAYTAGAATNSIFYVRPYNAGNTTAAGRYQALNLGQCNGTTYTLTAEELADSAHNASAPGTVCQVDYTQQYGVINPNIERYGASARATKKLGDSIEAYLELNFMQSESDYTGSPAVIRGSAPTGIFNPQFSTSDANANRAPGSGILALPIYVCALPSGAKAVMVNGVPTIPGGCTAANGKLNPNNPFAAAGQVARIIGRDLGNVTYNETRNRAYRAALGVSGPLSDKVSFDFGSTYMHTELKRTQNGYVYIQHLLDAIADGSYNFLNPSANTQAVKDYVSPSNITKATSDLFQVQGNLAARLFDLPGGALQVAVGASAHYEAVDSPSANSDANGPAERYYTLNAFGTKGSRWIHAAYYEISAPVIKPLELGAAGRYDHYSSGQSAFSPKFSAKFRPISQVLLRATYSKGFRIPSFGEANALPTTGYVTNTKDAFNDTYLAQYGCTKATFTSCPTYIRSGSYGQTTLASPNLNPEKSDSLTLGLLIEPIRGVSLTLDYYRIKKTGVITQPSNSPALAAYYAGEAIPSIYNVIPDAVDPNYPNAKPRIAFVQSQLINADTLRSEGLDMGLEINRQISPNVKWTSSLEASYIIKLEADLTASGGGIERYDGTLGNFNLTAGSGTPKWHGALVNSLDFGDHLRLTGTVNYFGGYDLSAMDQGTEYKDCGLDPGYSPTGCGVPGYTTVDFNASIKVNDNFTIYGTILNIANRMPPIDVVTYGAQNYNPVQGGTGILGRYFKVGVKLNK